MAVEVKERWDERLEPLGHCHQFVIRAGHWMIRVMITDHELKHAGFDLRAKVETEVRLKMIQHLAELLIAQESKQGNNGQPN